MSYTPPINYKTMIIKYKVLWVMINSGNDTDPPDIDTVSNMNSITDYSDSNNNKYYNYGLGIGNKYSTDPKIMKILTNNTYFEVDPYSYYNPDPNFNIFSDNDDLNIKYYFLALYIDFGENVYPIGITGKDTDHTAILCSDGSVWRTGNNPSIRSNRINSQLESIYTFIKQDGKYNGITCDADITTYYPYLQSSFPSPLMKQSICGHNICKNLAICDLENVIDNFIQKIEIDSSETTVDSYSYSKKLYDKYNELNIDIATWATTRSNFINTTSVFLQSATNQQNTYTYTTTDGIISIANLTTDFKINMFYKFYYVPLNDIYDSKSKEIKKIYGYIWLNNTELLINGRQKTDFNLSQDLLDQKIAIRLITDVKVEYYNEWNKIEESIKNGTIIYKVPNNFNGYIKLENYNGIVDTYNIFNTQTQEISLYNYKYVIDVVWLSENTNTDNITTYSSTSSNNDFKIDNINKHLNLNSQDTLLNGLTYKLNINRTSSTTGSGSNTRTIYKLSIDKFMFNGYIEVNGLIYIYFSEFPNKEISFVDSVNKKVNGKPLLEYYLSIYNSITTGSNETNDMHKRWINFYSSNKTCDCAIEQLKKLLPYNLYNLDAIDPKIIVLSPPIKIIN